MSTILKALRRLEEEGSNPDSNRSKTAQPAQTDPAGASPTAPASVGGGLLRDRILAEEVAAQALAPEPAPSKRGYQIGLLATVATVALAALVFGVNRYLESSGAGRIRIEDPLESPRASAPTAAAAAPVAVADASAGQAAPSDPTRLSLENILAAQPPRTETGARDVEPSTASDEALPPTQAPPQIPTQAPTHTPAPTQMAPSRRAIPVPVAPTPALASDETDAPSPALASTSDETDAPSAPSRARLDDAAVSPTPAVSAQRKARSIRSLPEAAPSTVAATAAAATATGIATATDDAAAVPPDRERVTGPLAAADRASSEATFRSSTPREASESRPTYAEAQAREAAPVERIDHRGLPDLVVVRTSWHPDASRRSAKIRVLETDETLTLREGDAVGGLVIEEITPSSVLFQAGEVEIRRKVGSTN